MRSATSSVPETAVELLRWPERIRPMGEGPCLLAGSCTGATGAVQGGFLAWMRGRFPAWDEDDLNNEIDGFFTKAASVPRWYEETLDRRGIEIEIWSGAPRIRTDAFAAWAALTRKIDPDALITLILAKSRSAADVMRLHQWGTYATTYNAGIRRLIVEGMADTHVHLGGCDTVPMVWIEVMAALGGGRTEGLARRRLEQVRRYQPRVLQELKNRSPEEHRRRQREIALIRDAAAIRSILLEHARRAIPVELPRTECGGSDWAAPWLAEERLLLAWAWGEILQGQAPPPMDEEKLKALLPSGLAEHATLVRSLRTELTRGGWLSLLDRYLFAKNLFLDAHYLGPEGNPGLRRFRRYLDQLEPAPPQRFRRFEERELCQRVLFAAESPALERLELRIAPKKSKGEWLRFLELWKQVSTEVTKDRRLELDLVVHFLRPTHRPGVRINRIPYESVRRRVAQRSALLHLVRQTCPESQPIVGIDVANVERDCPPEVFFPYLRLLRGARPEAVLLREDWETPWSRPWVELLRRRQLGQPVHLPKLGLTFHAGESFYTPVQGLRFIHSIVFGLRMGPGDRIGHGLALGLDVGRVLQRRGAGIRVPRRVLLEDCVWLLYRLAPQSARFPEAVTQLRKWTAELSEAIYGAPQPFETLWALHIGRAKLPPPRPAAGSREPNPWYEERAWRRLWAAELFDEECKKRAEEKERVPFEALGLGEAIAVTQQALVADIARKRICIETAPSSNLALGEMDTLEEHPFHRLVRFDGGRERVIVSISTDDPGLFATRIENELTLMVQSHAARHEEDADGSMAEALEFVENARRNGLQSAFRRVMSPESPG